MHQFRVKTLEALFKECLLWVIVDFAFVSWPSTFNICLGWRAIMIGFSRCRRQASVVNNKTKALRHGNSLQQKVGQTFSPQRWTKLDYASCSRVKHQPQGSIDTVKTVVLETDTGDKRQWTECSHCWRLPQRSPKLLSSRIEEVIVMAESKILQNTRCHHYPSTKY